MSDILSPAHPPPVLHTDALPGGTRLSEFEIVRLLGVGGFGMVYQAYDHSLHRSVAIKEYMPSALAGRASGLDVGIRSAHDAAAYQAGLQSFVAEARLLAQFDHPSLVKVFRFWEAHHTAYMVMPLYSGMTLKQARSQMRSPPPEAWLRPVLWSVLQALQLLHDSHTLHRDVSPENIFLQDCGPPVLLDLGAARRAIGDLGSQHTAVLKVNYAPIEQYADAQDMRPGAWSDLYALAAVVHGCLSNVPPLPATFRVLRDRLPSMQALTLAVQAQHGNTYSPAFVDALGRSLAIPPEQRPPSVQAFIQALGLQAPPEMASFDWRAALGADWQSSGPDPVPLEKVDRSALPTQFVYPPRPSVDLSAGRMLAVSPPVRLRPFRRRVLLACVAVAGLAVALLWPGEDVPPRLAAVPQVLPAVEAVALEPPLQLEVVAEPVQAAPTLAAQAPPVQVRKPRPPVKTPPRREAVPRAVAETASAPRVLAQAEPEPLCTDSNFFTRPMCMYRECQKPAFAQTPACVENTQRLLANQQSRR